VDKRILYEERISNPRVKVVEYADDDGVFKKKTIEVENPEFTLRVALDPKTRYLVIIGIGEKEAETKILNLTEIN